MRCKKGEIEDDAHILSRCTFSKDLLTKRHDYVLGKIAKEIKKSRETIRVYGKNDHGEEEQH